MVRLLRVRWTVEPRTVVLRLVGDLDASARDDIHAVETVADSAPPFIVDLSGITFVDIIGLDLLDSLVARDGVTVRDASHRIRRVLERTEGLDGEWPSLRAAIGSDVP